MLWFNVFAQGKNVFITAALDGSAVLYLIKISFKKFAA